MKIRLLPFITFIIVILDQALKRNFIINTPDSISINPAVAFSQGTTSLLILGVILLALLMIMERGKPGPIWISLIFATASNIMDRLRFGGVIDYITTGRLHYNLADILICVLVAYLAGYIWHKKDAHPVSRLEEHLIKTLHKRFKRRP